MNTNSALRSPFIQATLLLLLAGSMIGCRSTASVADSSQGTRERQLETLRDLGFELDQDRWLMSIAEPISFEFDRTELRTTLQPSLLEMASELRDVGIARLRVEGHTDDIGNVDYNEVLSLRRSQAVAEVFVAAGFQRKDIACHGWAAQHPIASNTSREGRARNRRVDVIVPMDALEDH